MMLQYSPDIIDWSHVVEVIEKEHNFRAKYEAARKYMREQNRKYIKKKI